MSAGWFALGGVVIGGLLNGFVSWLQARSTTRSTARVSALLVTEELLQSLAAFPVLDEVQTWGALQDGHRFGKSTAWESNRQNLGYALVPDAYMCLAAAYSGLAQAVLRASKETHDAPVSRRHNEALKTTSLALNRGLTYLSKLVHRPPAWKLAARRAFDRTSDAHIAMLVSADTNVQAFMAKYGGQQGAAGVEPETKV
jgi:hypothetical protein